MQLSQSANDAALTKSRLPHVDALRGLALLGIGIENLLAVHTPNPLMEAYAAQYPDGLNHWLLVGLMVLVRGKFYPVFALVFGIAAAYSIPKDGDAYFIKRSVVLLLLGVLQVVFIWQGDVLVQYALMSCLLLLFRPLPAWGLFLTGALLLAFSFLTSDRLMALVPVQQPADLAVYATGTYRELLFFRVQDYGQSLFSWKAVVFYPKIFAFMLLGYGLVKSKFLLALTQTKVACKSMIAHLGLVLGIILFFEITGWRQEGNQTAAAWLRALFLAFFYYALVSVYALLPFVLTRLLSGLQWLGKLTLTHYITQNVIFCGLMFGYGLGWYGTLAPLALVLLYAGVIGLQLMASGYWVRKFGLGPIEALLRTAAGRKN